MTPVPFNSNPAEDDTERTAGPAPAPDPVFAVPPHPAPSAQLTPVMPPMPPMPPPMPSMPPAMPARAPGVPVVAAAPVGPAPPYEAPWSTAAPPRPTAEAHGPTIKTLEPAPKRPEPSVVLKREQTPETRETAFRTAEPPVRQPVAKEPEAAAPEPEAREPRPAPAPPEPEPAKRETEAKEPAAEAKDPAPSAVPVLAPVTASAVSNRADADDEAIHTLLWTAATERPVAEVASLVARLKETGELSSPGDVALRAAAVSRPLEEVRQLVALLNESGYDLQQAETTLRAAAVGRPIEDVVQLVSILGTGSSEWRSPGGSEAKHRPAPAPAAAPAEDRPAPAREAVPVLAPAPKQSRQPKPPKEPKRSREESGLWPKALNGALAAGPGSHTSTPGLRSPLRWPAAFALFACGLIHLPTDLAGLGADGYAGTVSLTVAVLCLVFGVWIAARDTLGVWAASAGLAVGVIALHALASARTVDLLTSSLGSTFAWAKAVAVLSGAAVVALAGSAVVRHTKTTTGAPDSA
ncbi:hypothetical protein [Streptomyces sp. NPDC008121]|uniref:hypothetical protein n=1 Tax=Streptomyces sp. NPDC008121 TaxID=3364809 RepID=UPI0036E6AC28